MTFDLIQWYKKCKSRYIDTLWYLLSYMLLLLITINIYWRYFRNWYKLYHPTSFLFNLFYLDCPISFSSFNSSKSFWNMKSIFCSIYLVAFQLIVLFSSCIVTHNFLLVLTLAKLLLPLIYLIFMISHYL